MTRFAEFSAEVTGLRQQIDEIMAVEGYLVEDVAAKAATLNQLLKVRPADALTHSESEYSLFLTEQLHWLSDVIAKLNAEKTVIASGILRSQRRKKAEKMYGENR
ncbi:hypothetical protein [Arsukibacterium sp.]|uniref:hypothetical protein n=1 Tax=Arsukibacterium sp. TaxID=1977258 RepID=UPI00299EE772|nr:hypothetical protein [Arsukibacterium sp.]MDX1538628.1 hypothetical protein [Arsukibacterium sp.]